MVMSWVSCGKGAHSHPLPDTLVVGTLYSPTGFFILHGDTLGYDFDRITDFARDKGIALRFRVAPNIQALIGLLEQDSIDIIACEVPHTAEFKKRVLGCGAVNETHQVLIQHSGDSVITDVTQLVGRDIYVERGSKYESRLRNLDSELGGGIKIHPINTDTLMPEDLIAMVSDHKLPLTVVDSDIAQFNHTYYDSIDISLAVSFAQRSSWAVGKDKAWLADSINNWANSGNAQAYSKTALRRYFEMSKHRSHDTTVVLPSTPPGGISPYDSLFKAYSATIGWDWRMLAAIGYCESRFNPNDVSWAGARGIMQIMPSTAKDYGLSMDKITDPEANISTAVLLIKSLIKKFTPLIANENERVKFILASYNGGVGHVLDAIALARKYDKDPQVWDGNVEEAILWKSNPQFYNDRVCRYGYFRGRETVDYVAKVEQRYRYYRNKFPMKGETPLPPDSIPAKPPVKVTLPTSQAENTQDNDNQPNN